MDDETGIKAERGREAGAMITRGRVILSDVVLTEPDVVRFVRNCMVQTGGVRRVKEDLETIGHGGFSRRAYADLRRAERSGELDLLYYSAKEPHAVCSSIVASAASCCGLQTLMGLTRDEADSLLDGPRPVLTT